MRKVSKEIAEAFVENKNKVMSNTRICPVSNWVSNGEMGVYLHDNKIAWWENNHPYKNKHGNIHLSFCLCGWGTPTTRERLNTIFHHVFWDKKNDPNQLGSNFVYLKQIKGKQYLFIWDKQIEINKNLNYVIRSVNGNVFLDDPIKKTG
jgi:hypothetical protein